MKESKYNFYARQDDDIWIYNSVSKKVVKIKDSVLKNLKKSIVSLSEEELQKDFGNLIEYGMLCPDLEKEEKQCIENLQKDKMKPKLELTIMASTACNFRCEYCYEELI